MTAVDLGMTEDGRYDVYRVIARGAMGVVYEARHQVTGRRVALKRLSPEHGRNAELRIRFQLEARVLGTVAHPFVVDILDATMAGDDPYIVLEYLDGGTLEGTLITRGFLSPTEAIDIALDLCEALAAIHGSGVLHRDVKPNNIFVGARETPRHTIKLIDFGIATFETRAPDKAHTLVSLAHPTMPGGIVGTPEYMAPEQLQGTRLDARADLYALGVTLFEMLTGKVPFGGLFHEVLIKVEAAKRKPTAIRAVRADVPEALAKVITKALHYEKSERFQTALEFRDALIAARRARDSVAAPVVAPAARPAPPKVMLTDLNHSHLAQNVASYRRRFARVPYTTPVRLRVGDRVLEGRSENISEGGLLVITNDLCGDGEPVEIELALPSTGTLVKLGGVARWARVGRTGKALGVEFGDVPQRVRLAIKGLVARLRPQATTQVTSGNP